MVKEGDNMCFIVAVDGPAGSGKGTITKLNIDTGATYRSVALAAIQNGLTAENEEEIIELVNNLNIQIEKENGKDVVYLNGEDVTKKIREKEVTQLVSFVSAIIPVREKMVELQRKLAEGKNVIVEGRDIGTVVFPNADLKIYLDASEEIRAERRYKENIQAGMNVTYEEILKSIKLRDENDKNKKYGALKKADDAIVINTSEMTIEEAKEAVKEMITAKMKTI